MRFGFAVVMLGAVAACAGTRSESLASPPVASSAPVAIADAAADPSARVPSMETDAGAFMSMVARFPKTGMDDQTAFEDKTQAAFDALLIAKGGLTPAVVDMFRAAAKTRTTASIDMTSLDGALSDDGLALVVKMAAGSVFYFADPKTGVLRGQRRGRWSEGTRVLAKTHDVPMFDLERTHNHAVLRVFDAVTGSMRFDVAGVRYCGSSAGSAIAYSQANSNDKEATASVRDFLSARELDWFDVPVPADKWDGCVRLVRTPSTLLALALFGGDSVLQSILIRDAIKKKTLATITGGASVELRLAPNGTLLAIAERPNQYTRKFPGQVLLVDLSTGKTVASSSACPSAGSLLFNEKGTMLIAGDQRDACIFSVPALKLLRRTAPARDPFLPGQTTQVMRDVRFFAKEQALLVRTEDEKAVVYKVSTGDVLWKGERGGFIVDGDSAHFLGRKSEDDPYVHIVIGPDLKIHDEGAPTPAVMKKLYEARWRDDKSQALRDALARVAAASCEVEGALFPKEACAPP